MRGKKHFPIIGIGGSAGGLEAFEELLKNISDNPGAALVFIMHLAPEHKSLLPELLARKTKMPVSEITNGMVPEINHVYTKPPNTNLSMAGGKLILSKREGENVKHMPIDYFFRSLADELGNGSIGVILSGTAADGTLGLGAIKAAGGITFAEDEKSAAYNDMPKSAIAAGCVDFVLSPKKIAAELERVARHPFVLSAAPLKTDKPIMAEGKSLKSVFDILRRAKGLDFIYYKTTTITRRVSRRIILTKQGNLKNYIKFLRENKNEADCLYEDILINVTGFFRDPKVFHALEKSVIPKILKSKTKDRGVRIWVPGCSSGEEAYSIAMLFAEAMRKKADIVPVQIFATDVSDNGINKARRGVYGQSVKYDIDPARLKRYFVKEGKFYKISKSLRDMCVFSKQNVFNDPPFSNVDIISCRNLLIYFQSVLQKKVFHNFHYSLRPDGFLILGNSESAAGYSNLFKNLDRKQKIFVKKYVSIGPGLELSQKCYPLNKLYGKEKIVINTGKEVDVALLADKVMLNECAPCGAVINGLMEVVQFRGHTGRFLESAAGKPSLDIFKLTREGLSMPLRSAIYKARKIKHTVKREADNALCNGRKASVMITVIPLKSAALKEEFFLVLFNEIGRTGGKFKNSPRRASGRSLKGMSAEKNGYIKDIEKELAETKEYLKTVTEEQESVNEELKTANEEILSSNEELQSTNEELETSKEELQSSNEELTTTNEELQNRNAEVSLLNGDLINLLGNINVPIIILGMDLVIRRVTSQAEKNLNLTSSDVGRPINKIKLNIDIPDLEKTIFDVIESLHPKMLEIKDKDGRWYSVHIRPYRTIDNKIDGATVMFIDITERKKAGLIVEEARAYAENILDTILESLVILGEDLKVISVNRAFYHTFKVSPNKTIGRLIYDLGDRQWDIPALRQLLEDVLSRKTSIMNYEVEHNFETIGPKTMLVNARRLDNPKIIIITFDDITGRKRADEKLMASEASYRAIFESASDAIIIRDANTFRVTDANKKACEMFSYSSDEMKELPLGFLNVISDQYPIEKLKSFYEKALKEGPQIFEWPAKDKLGKEFWIEVNVKSAVIGEQPRLLYIARDITARKKAEQNLLEATEMKTSFITNISHELRTPLGAIKESIAIIVDGLTGAVSEEQGKYLNIAKQNVDRLARLINNVLDFQKLEFGKLVFNWGENDINEAIREAYNAMLPLAQRKELDFILKLGDNLPRIRFDKDKIIQVLTNLINNSLKVTREGGITITSRAGNNIIEVLVQDTGFGIKEEDIPRLFRQFEQLEKKTGGTGLGLAISKDIITAHNGKIWIESTVGQGTVVHFILPIVERRGGARA